MVHQAPISGYLSPIYSATLILLSKVGLGRTFERSRFWKYPKNNNDYDIIQIHNNNKNNNPNNDNNNPPPPPPHPPPPPSSPPSLLLPPPPPPPLLSTFSSSNFSLFKDT